MSKHRHTTTVARTMGAACILCIALLCQTCARHPASQQPSTTALVRTNIVLHPTSVDDVLSMPQVGKPARVKVPEGKELLASGSVRFPDGQPMTNGIIYVYWQTHIVNGEEWTGPGEDAFPDSAGKFAIYAKPTNDNEQLNMRIVSDEGMSDEAWLVTNVAKGSSDLDLTLCWTRYVSGRACIGTSSVPATNCLVSLLGRRAGYCYRSDDTNGQFILVDSDMGHVDPPWVVRIECPSFAPVDIKIDEMRDVWLGLGDIVLTARASTVCGCIRAYYNTPFLARVSLQPIGMPDISNQHLWVEVEHYEFGGNYQFLCLATGLYNVIVASDAEAVTNAVRIPRLGEEVTMPDVVLEGPPERDKRLQIGDEELEQQTR